MTQPIPAGYHSVTPSLTFKDSETALRFYKKAFGAEVVDVFPNLDRKGVMHATFQIGNSILMCGDENIASPNCPKSAETTGSSPVSLFVYVPNADETFNRAIAAGCTVMMPMMDMFWGDRAGNLKDPFGYQWMIATHIKDYTKAEIKKNAADFFEKMKGQ